MPPERSNEMYDLGLGDWLIYVYKLSEDTQRPVKPEENIMGPFEGTLLVAKDFHRVYTQDDRGNKMFIACIPSQNVAGCVNKFYYEE